MLQRRLARWRRTRNTAPIEPGTASNQTRWLGKNRDRNVSRKWHYCEIFSALMRVIERQPSPVPKGYKRHRHNFPIQNKQVGLAEFMLRSARRNILALHRREHHVPNVYSASVQALDENSARCGKSSLSRRSRLTSTRVHCGNSHAPMHSLLDCPMSLRCPR